MGQLINNNNKIKKATMGKVGVHCKQRRPGGSLVTLYANVTPRKISIS